MKTILVSVDFSAATRAVVDTAVELTAGSPGRIILHHTQVPPVISTEYGLGVELLQETLALNEKSARRQLAHLESDLAGRGLAVTTALSHGHPATQILAHAEMHHADLIVLGSHGHTAFYELLVGSTTHDVLKKAKCPVVIVPPARTA